MARPLCIEFPGRFTTSLPRAMPGKPTSSVTSDNPKECRKRAVGTHQKIVVQGANARAERVVRDRDDLVDHDLRHMLETVGCGRLYG